MTNFENTNPQDLSEAKYMVAFISTMSENSSGYSEAADKMMEMVRKQDGFVGVYSARSEQGVGITNSYWSSLEAIKCWKENSTHQSVQEKGKFQWYRWYQLQICKIDRSYDSIC